MAVVSLWSCNQFADLEDLQGANYRAEYAVPLINTEFGMADILANFEEEATLSADADGLLHFRYSGDVLTKTADDIFATINQDIPPVLGIAITQERQGLPFMLPGNVTFDRINLNMGKFGFQIKNDHDKSVEITLTLPTVKKDGVALSVTRTLPAYSGTGPVPSLSNALSPISLADYVVTTENDTIFVEFMAVDSDGLVVPPADGTVIGITEIRFDYAEGYLGQEIYEGGRDTIEIDFFDNWILGDVYFENPVITMSIENSFGIPTRSVINVFNILTVTGETLPLESELIDNGVDFPYPTLDEVGEVKTNSYTFTRDNSNIDVVLGSQPVAIDYDVNAITNPEEDTEVRGFITDSSYYKVRVNVDLPLYGNAVNFIARDTFDLNLETYDNVQSAEFKLVTENGLPLAVDVQGYFMDENGVVLDSLLLDVERLIAAAPVDAMGNPTMETRKVTFADFGAERFARIRGTQRLLLVATFSTTNEGTQSVRLNVDQRVKFKLGAILEVTD